MPRLAKGDMVLIVSGDDAGKTGKVLKVLPEKDRVVVEGVNFIKRHTKPTQRNPQGGINEREAAIHLSNVQPLCTKCNKPARVTTRRSGGSAVRVCRRCGQQLENT